MTGDDIKSLRKELGLTQRQMAEALKLDVAEVRNWETGETFATRAHCLAMEKLRQSPPPKPARGASTPGAVMADPGFWALMRKLVAHPKLRAECAKLAEGYDDVTG
ncbi:MAG: helix-turn-helix transcriptional regulator [Myxococcales bacterium]|nr:helix-turn-helix transcriptional regulator [Myxococcales bacterium]